MDKWILIALVVFIIGECVRAVYDYKVVNRNYKVHEANEEEHQKRIEHLERELDKKNRDAQVLQSVMDNAGWETDPAYLITTGGLKMCPKGWRDKIFP